MKTEQQFTDAEHLWFWFVSSKKIRTGIRRRNSDYTGNRPCELLDVETLVTKMYLSGKISENQLDVMKKYGELRRAPNQYVFAENSDAILWNSAMRAIDHIARIKGWIE